MPQVDGADVSPFQSLAPARMASDALVGLTAEAACPGPASMAAAGAADL
jgi:hypothetical protein